MRKVRLGLWGCLWLLTFTWAQTIQVDTRQPVNQFVPRETLGAGVDRIPVQAIDSGLREPALSRALSSGWGPVTYRQNTELAVEAWHWNPLGTWSDPRGKGYFTGSTALAEPIRYSFGYRLPRRGFTRNDGTENAGFSRLTDGNLESFWKTNPYLSQRFTGESDSLHPQWVVMDLQQAQMVNAIRIAWAKPYATDFLVQYWTGDDPIKAATRGVWERFPGGMVSNGKGGAETIRLAPSAMPVRFVRIWMTASSNTCDAEGASDPRNCLGYAIRELYLGTISDDGAFHDVVRHTADQEQTTTYCSSVDPWHEPSDIGSTTQAQVGFDFFYRSGVTRGMPAMIPVAMLYDTPENAAAEIAYLEKRKYPISYVEMGEEADGQYMLPEDYAALYLQWATAIHRVDPALKLGGPSFQGVNKDIEAWPDAGGRTSWLGRFVDYLKQHGRMQDLAFFSFEHYPYDPCRTPWGMLYDEPELVNHIIEVWREDGIPTEMPMFITEGNLSWGASETYQDIFAGVWLADYVGSFLSAGGQGLYFFHYLPLKLEPGCNGSPGTFGMFTVDDNYHIEQPLAQFFVAQLINLEWVQANGGEHQVFAAHSDLSDGAGHALVTAYVLRRTDGQWAVMAVNRDQETAHKVRIVFHRADGAETGFSGAVETATFGSGQYRWIPPQTRFMAHAEQAAKKTIVIETNGKADPDGPVVRRQINVTPDMGYDLPAASVVVIRGRLAQP
ncbi:MAG TPA: discoidin domain-containing protein [Terriglobales bacterium]|nr:discoidin domain-containing protein [Terriglobales bacterium]